MYLCPSTQSDKGPVFLLAVSWSPEYGLEDELGEPLSMS